jgi:murein L,D-transpeptidase YafK
MTPLLLIVIALSFTAADSARTVARRPIAPLSGTVTIADSIVVEKSLHQLTLFLRGAPVKRYMVALGSNPTGAKVQRGDNRTPEGLYRIEARNPKSKYHRALRVSYPNAQDRARAARLGVSPGGDIMIHGLPKAYAYVGADHRLDDWTQGCIALTNEEIEEIYRAVPLGAAILIKP